MWLFALAGTLSKNGKVALLIAFNKLTACHQFPADSPGCIGDIAHILKLSHKKSTSILISNTVINQKRKLY